MEVLSLVVSTTAYFYVYCPHGLPRALLSAEYEGNSLLTDVWFDIVPGLECDVVVGRECSF
jgi:hypothetical protein